jgi:hypothetical protein
MIEHHFIMEKTLELEKAKDVIAMKYYYRQGDILMCHINTKESIHTKRRKKFDTLATFINYEDGNVLVQLHNNNQKIVLPIYSTKYLTDSTDDLNIDEKKTFLLS